MENSILLALKIRCDSLTIMQSDCFYNAGWTEDTRVVIDYLHREYAKAPLFAVGTSIGANILVCGPEIFPLSTLYV